MENPKLYIKGKGGRYEPYTPPDPPFDNALYRKRLHGNKVVYEPVGMSVSADTLEEGVWVITKHPSSKMFSNGTYLRDRFMCQKASDIQDVSLAKLGGMDKLAHCLLRHWDELPKQCTPYDLCCAIVGILLKYEEENG